MNLAFPPIRGEALLARAASALTSRPPSPLGSILAVVLVNLQGYLAYKKPHHPRTLQ